MFLFISSTIFVVVVGGVALVAYVRRVKARKHMEGSLARWMKPPAYTLGIPEHPAIAEARAEMDRSMKLSEKRWRDEAWRRDGRVWLEKRKTS